MSYDFENPFYGYGTIVHGERFIGRKESLKVIENRIIRPNDAGNLAIIGEPKIGKSSLVYKSITDRKDELATRNLLPIWINLGTYDNVLIFFRSLVTKCVDEMRQLNWLSESIQHSASLLMDDELSWSESYGRIQKFFKKVRHAGYRILFVLDEFDHARNLFRDAISGFQGLRELSYNPEWRVTYITISRRNIRDIELQSGSISTFANIFHNHYLVGFNDKDLEEYFMRLSSIGISVSFAARERIVFYCGGYPSLLEILGHEIAEVFREEHKVDIEKAAYHTTMSFLNQYDHMVKLLREDGSLNKLLQVLFGPVVDVKQTDVDEFLRYGLIMPLPQERYTGFSGHFHAFLNLIEREVDLWPLWSDTEKSLRHLITKTMLDRYEDNWVTQTEKARPNLKTIFNRCREAQQKEEKSFGSRASRDLIDFTYPQDLFAIVFAEWSNFKSVFGKDKNYWDQRAQLLAKIRTPLAHNREASPYNYERQIAEGYCKEILAIVKLM